MSAKVVADGVKHDAPGVESVECLVDNMSQQVNNANKFFESDDGTNSIALMNAKSTGKGVELVLKSNWVVVTKKKSPSIGIGSPIRNTVQPVVDSQTMNSGAQEIVLKEVSCFNTFDALTNNIVHEINSSQVNSTNELVISKEQQGATSTPRWGDITDEEEEQVNSPPMQKKLSPTAPAFVPSGAKLVTPRQGLSSSTNVVAILSDHLVSSNIKKLASLTPINTNKQLQFGCRSTLSLNEFANLDDEDIYEEGEEEEMLDYCFAIAARNAYISTRHQRNNKTKHGRKHSWDGKVTEEFVPRHLPMRLAKQNHMIVSTTLTRSNKAKKTKKKYIDPTNKLCVENFKMFKNLVSGINDQQILEPFCGTDSDRPHQLSSERRSLEEDFIFQKYDDFICRESRVSLSNVTSKSIRLVFLDELHKYKVATRKLSTYWANDPRVQEALHVRKYTVSVTLSSKGYRSLIYSGDHDMLVPFQSTQAWISY
ncbi:hypothetical protein H5410_063169 [Solanum commersonii]|uniref:Uncharacterized protein n=1 Tax=Solanum commersonii TaxID=4109 RepID=A0A9J5WCH7_SOLCO|nr:hypothetical protein H5410_063169 [Solanum commersonii]